MKLTRRCLLQDKCLKPHLVLRCRPEIVSIWQCSAFWRDLIMDPSASVNFPLIDNPRDSPFDDLRDFTKWPTKDLALVDIPVTIWISSQTFWKPHNSIKYFKCILRLKLKEIWNKFFLSSSYYTMENVLLIAVAYSFLIIKFGATATINW